VTNRWRRDGRSPAHARRDRRRPLAALVRRARAEDAVAASILEFRRRSCIEAPQRIGRSDLTEEAEQLRGPKRLFGQGNRGAILHERRQLVLHEAKRLGAVAHHDGEQSVQLWH